MPIFDFKCAKCGHVMVDFIAKDSDVRPECEKCGASTERMWKRAATFKFGTKHYDRHGSLHDDAIASGRQKSNGPPIYGVPR